MTFVTFEREITAVLSRMYDIPAQDSPHARRTLAACASAATELARAAQTLHRIGETQLATTLAGYASGVTDMACEHLRKSDEIKP